VVVKPYLALASLVLLVAGCGGDNGAPSGPYSCDLRSGGTTQNACQEYQALDSSQVTTSSTNCIDANQHCMGLGNCTAGVWTSMPCPHAGSLGGCTLTSGGLTVTLWSYPGGTATMSSVMTLCSNAQGTYVAP
jgi:hypothetical protein